MILVTGAAGLIGGATVQTLVNAGCPVIALVHSNCKIVGNDAAPVPARAFDMERPERGQVKWLQGDIQKDGLGLDPAVIAWLQRHVDVVVHCAALVRFEAEAATLQAVNVQGTLNVAGLLPDARFLHVSTAYVCGLRDGLIAETNCVSPGEFGNGYEQSKAIAEVRLHAMRPDACIVRPSIVVGEASSGRIRDFDTIYRAFKFIAEGRIEKVPVAASATLNFVPIDHVVEAIRDLAVRMTASETCNGHIMHLAARKAVPAAQFLALIGQVPGLKAPIIASPGETMPSSAGLSERLVKPYWGYFKRCPDFETVTAEKLLGRPAPDMSGAALVRQIEYCVKAGFIRSSLSAA